MSSTTSRRHRERKKTTETHLELEGHLALAERVGDGGEREDVEGTPDEAEQGGHDDEDDVPRLAGRLDEEGDAEVDVDGRLGEERGRLEEVGERGARRDRDVVRRVVLEREPGEEDSHNAGQLGRLADAVGDVAGADEHGQGQVGLAHLQALEQERHEHRQDDADHGGPSKLGDEQAQRLEDLDRAKLGLVHKDQERLVHGDRHRIVHDALAKHQRVERAVHLDWGGSGAETGADTGA